MSKMLLAKNLAVLSILGWVGTAYLQAQEDDHEFPSGINLPETGENGATWRLAEGFEGLDAEPGKTLATDPIDGAGGFDNVAPKLGSEVGPGGLDWDPSPTYRTRYKSGTDYAAGTGKRIQGNNWFPSIPYVVPYSSTRYVRFDANTFRVYNQSGSFFVGQYGNLNSKMTETGTSPSRTWKIFDTRGKTFTFDEAYAGRLTKIEGLGGAEITITYGANITVLQKPTSTSGSEVRRFTYYLNAAQTRIDRIEVEEKVSGTWTIYRKVDFTYHEDIAGAVEGSTGDLIGITEEKLLSPASTWEVRKWVFRYYTGAYNATSNPGYAYQVRSVLEPQSVRDWESANSSLPTTDIFKQSTNTLDIYVDRIYQYASDKRVRQIDFKSSCGCGGGEGTYAYTWDVNNGTISDLNTWAHRVTITLPSDNGGSQIIDYNKYGQLLNAITQEVAGNSSSRRWIRTWTHDTTGRLTDSYSVKACDSYTDASHSVTTNTTGGMRFQYSYDGNSALATAKLRDPSNGNWNYQLKKAFSLITSGDRRRFVKTSQTVYPSETTTDTGGVATTWSYTYYASDALAVKKRTTALPAVSTGENGSGTSVSLYDYFETDGLNTWSKDGDGFVHYTGYDTQRRTVTKTVRNVNTDAAYRPAGVPAPPMGEGFDSFSGLNIVTDFTYDFLRRKVKEESPDFAAWNGTSVASTRTTRQWFYTRLLGGARVVVGYDHLPASYYHHALRLSVYDHDGHLVTSALGELTTQNTVLSDDIDTSDATLEVAFNGTIVRRTDYTYVGGKLDKEEVWRDADNAAGGKQLTEHEYDGAGRRWKTTNPAGTITKWSYDVLNRVKTTKVGTDDGVGTDNMTLIEERFYDDEEDSAGYVGEGNQTRVNRYATNGGSPRTTDYSYDYRRRVTQVDSPLNVREAFTYTNRNQVDLAQRLDRSTSPATLMAQTQKSYDSWGRAFRTKVFRVPLVNLNGDSSYDYAKTESWWNARGLEVKTLSQGKILNKTQYDGAGRVIKRSISYDTAETAYGDALTLANDTVIEETNYVLDSTGAAQLTASLHRNHDGTGLGALDGSSGNARAQYAAMWYDPMHRATHSVVYGTNGGTDLTARPSGNPPSTSSSTTQLVTRYSYTPQSQVKDVTDPRLIVKHYDYDDVGRVLKEIDNHLDGTPGPNSDQDRTRENTFDSSGRLTKITAKLAGYNHNMSTIVDVVTEYVYGVTRGVGATDSRLSSNDLVKEIHYADPATGQPTTLDSDKEFFAYDAQSALIWKKDQLGTQHTYEHDARGRLINDSVPAYGTGVDTAVYRIGRTYDTLDRPVLVTSYAGIGSTLNEVKYEHGPFSTVSVIYQDWTGAVNTGSSPKVQYAYDFPADGTTALRLASVTYPDSTVVTAVYNAGMDDTLSRLSGQKIGTTWQYQDTYLGLSRLVEREYGGPGTGYKWTLVGTDTPNLDNYLGLDRYGRMDQPIVKQGATKINEYVYTYNENSQSTIREDKVGSLYGSYEFSETWGYDGLGRLTDHKRGVLSGGSITTIRLHECFTYDRSGNVLDYYSGTGSGCTPASTTSTFNCSNEYRTWSSGSIAYADSGNLTTKGGRTFAFDAWNRMVWVKYMNVLVSSYAYNGLGQKIVRTDATLPNMRYYYGLGYQVLEEREISSGYVHASYVYGTQYIDDLAVSKLSGSTKYWARDNNFNVVTRLGSTGSAEARYTYKSYGTPEQRSADWTTVQSITEDHYLFTSRQWNKDHAQYDFRARVQDPELLAFVQRDPIGVWEDKKNGGNPYGFVASDPWNSLDPEGLQQCGLRDAFVDMGDVESGVPPRCVCRWRCNCYPAGYICGDGPYNIWKDTYTYDTPDGDCLAKCMDKQPPEVACCPFTSGQIPPYQADQYAKVYRFGVKCQYVALGLLGAAAGLGVLEAAGVGVPAVKPIGGWLGQGGKLNANDFARIGFAWKKANGVDGVVFRIALGGRAQWIHCHLDIWEQLPIW